MSGLVNALGVTVGVNGLTLINKQVARCYHITYMTRVRNSIRDRQKQNTNVSPTLLETCEKNII